MSQEIDHARRHFLGIAAGTLAAGLGAAASANAQSGTVDTSFAPLKQIDAGVLNVGYVESGPADGQAVVLLHGWPYDVHTYADVAPRLASAGYRVIVPHLRGYGPTRFLAAGTVRRWSARKA